MHLPPPQPPLPLQRQQLLRPQEAAAPAPPLLAQCVAAEVSLARGACQLLSHVSGSDLAVAAAGSCLLLLRTAPGGVQPLAVLLECHRGGSISAVAVSSVRGQHRQWAAALEGSAVHFVPLDSSGADAACYGGSPSQSTTTVNAPPGAPGWQAVSPPGRVCWQESGTAVAMMGRVMGSFKHGGSDAGADRGGSSAGKEPARDDWQGASTRRARQCHPTSHCLPCTLLQAAWHPTQPVCAVLAPHELLLVGPSDAVGPGSGNGSGSDSDGSGSAAKDSTWASTARTGTWGGSTVRGDWGSLTNAAGAAQGTVLLALQGPGGSSAGAAAGRCCLAWLDGGGPCSDGSTCHRRLVVSWGGYLEVLEFCHGGWRLLLACLPVCALLLLAALPVLAAAHLLSLPSTHFPASKPPTAHPRHMNAGWQLHERRQLLPGLPGPVCSLAAAGAGRLLVTTERPVSQWLGAAEEAVWPVQPGVLQRGLTAARQPLQPLLLPSPTWPGSRGSPREPLHNGVTLTPLELQSGGITELTTGGGSPASDHSNPFITPPQPPATAAAAPAFMLAPAAAPPPAIPAMFMLQAPQATHMPLAEGLSSLPGASSPQQQRPEADAAAAGGSPGAAAEGGHAALLWLDDDSGRGGSPAGGSPREHAVQLGFAPDLIQVDMGMSGWVQGGCHM